MFKRKIAKLTLIATLATTIESTAQGLIVNEGGNGQGGNKDYYELLVIGSESRRTGNVNLSNWIIDDNNGEFGGSGSGKGIATGHIRLKSTCFSNIPIGAIIVIYNAADREPLLPADDPNDANGDSVYIIPHTSSCLELSNTSPTNSNILYDISATYSPLTTYSWSSHVSLNGDADAVQVRNIDGSFFHGFGYGFSSSILHITPTLPAVLGGGKAINLAGSGSNTTINYLYGSLSESNSYNKVSASTATPGAPNSIENYNIIDNIRNGTFDYSNWGNPNNWRNVALPLYLHQFSGIQLDQFSNKLTWSVSTSEEWSTIVLEKSIDGKDYQVLKSHTIYNSTTPTDVDYIDDNLNQTNIYRLYFKSSNGDEKYSKSILLNKAISKKELSLYPNPSQDIITLKYNYENQILNYKIVDLRGSVHQTGTVQANNHAQTINIETLSTGMYYLQLINTSGEVLVSEKISKL